MRSLRNPVRLWRNEMTYSHELLKATAQNKKIAKALVLQYDISMVVAA